MPNPLPTIRTVQAVLYGPLVLAGQFPLGTVPMPDLKQHGPDVAAAPIAVPSLATADGRRSNGWKPTGQLTWRSKGIEQDVVLKPFYQSDGRYTVYWQTV